MMTEAVEMCPFCGLESIFPNYDVKKSGLVATCQHCGEEMMLCDECYHCGDNDSQRCDWHEKKCYGGTEGHCFRGITHHPKERAGASQQEQNPTNIP